MPTVSIDAMNKHLAEISQCVSVSAIALLILDGAGWHSSPQLIVPDNIVLLPLPPYAPELNATENIWQYLRGNCLSHCVWDTYEAIVDACCDAWNTLMATPDVIASIGTREWAQVIPTAQKPDSWDSQTALDVSRCCKSLIRGGQDGVG